MNLDKETMKKILLIAFAIVLFYVGIGHLDVVFNGLKWVIALVFPFLFGICIAFILNVPMRAIERSLFDGYRGKRPKLIKKCLRHFNPLAPIHGGIRGFFLLLFRA